jgi:hypothetical protein
MKSFQLATAMALALGMGLSAHAQVYRDYEYGRGYPSYGRYDRGPRGGSPAYQTGLVDGQRDGERDMFRRHSFRPEQNSNFRHADRGYRGFFGDKRYYKEQYRAGYLEGYRMGYRGGGYYRR